MVFSPRNYGQTSDDYRKDPFHAGNPTERRRAQQKNWELFNKNHRLRKLHIVAA